MCRSAVQSQRTCGQSLFVTPRENALQENQCGWRQGFTQIGAFVANTIDARLGQCGDYIFKAIAP